MKTLILEGTLRKELGKRSAQELRRQGHVPCNLYGGKENINFSAPYNSFLNMVYNPDFFKVRITVNGSSHEALIKEIQFHPVTDRILHVDFIELIPGKKVITEIPLRFIGLAQGVKEGGKFVQKIRKLKVKAAPEDLVEAIEVNIENLQLGKSIYVKDIQCGNIVVLNSPEIPVASIVIPRSAKEEPKQTTETTTQATAAETKKEEKPAAKK